jgi:predicted permease
MKGLFRLSFRLLPRHRRERYGDEMRHLFAALAADARSRDGAAGAFVLLMQELRGIMRFALRERLARMKDWQPMGEWHPLRELHWAWHGVRGRGARAAVIVLLVGLALAGNVLMFAVADSVVFTRVPYPRAHEIVEIQSIRAGQPGGDRFLSAALLDEWRKQADLFASVQAYLTKTTFVVADGRSEIVPVADITPGLIELLGVRPAWGRSFTDDDAHATASMTFGPDGRAQVSPIPALISASLARERFGAPQDAVGRTLETTAYSLAVVGVMPEGFAFPQGSYRIWRALDPRGPLARGFAGVQSIARTAPGIPPDVLRAMMADRSAAIGQAAGARAGYAAAPGQFYVAAAGSSGQARTMFVILVGGALCLLLTACANVASLELAGALRRARTFAVQIALGASRGTLARVALLEGGLLMAAAALAGLGLAWLGLEALASYLPPRLASMTANPIDLDLRALVYMTAVAAVTWLLASLPVVVFASRANLLGQLKAEDRTAAASRGSALVRRGLTVAEIAIAVVLVVGAVMYTRSYVAMLGAGKGFDSSNLVQASFAIPVEYYNSPAEYREFADTVLARVRTLPGVIAAVDMAAPPDRGNSPFGGVRMEVDGRPIGEQTFTIGDSPVPAGYLAVVGLPLREGRWFDERDPAASAVVTESFARRFWPGGSAVGRTFRRVVSGGRESPVLQVIGVIAEFRSGRPDRTAASSADPSYYYYTLRQPPPAPVAPKPGAPPRPPSSGGSWRFLNVSVRLDAPDRAPAVLEAARSVDRRLRVTLESVDEKYAAMFADVLLATRVTGAFGALAFLVAVVGVYGVMAYLVAGRRREIGIRMALGAERRDVRRLVMTSAVRLGVVGSALGIAGALLVARWTSSQFYGVSATDPITHVTVAAGVLITAIVATWQPARQAARVDPAVTLRAE